ncbi:MAG: HDOD domain-containing protein [Comamonadaceae bacterium]|nr:HDOD domain-containing protein [Pseudomonadota bacterium]MBS0609545.1 HDOD domain-containing protein [Pseudomonadota bacterium]MDE2414201.1 HDOD domain-containing protein [Comamonadaceae bacterium]
MVQSVLGSLVLGYRPLWNAARKLAGVQLYVHGQGTALVDAPHLLRTIEELWSAGSPPLLLSPRSQPLLMDLLEHAPRGAPWIEVPGSWLAQPALRERARQARARGLRLVWSGALERLPDAETARLFDNSLLHLSGGDAVHALQAAAAAQSSPLIAGQLYDNVASRALLAHCLDQGGALAVAGWPQEDVLHALRRQPLQPAHEVMQSLLKAIEQDQSMDRFEQILGEDPLLAYRFMTYTNSAALGLRTGVDSLRRGLLMMGYGSLGRWLMEQLPHAAAEPDLRPIRSAMVLRARLTEQLLESGAGKDLRREVYLCGLFSQLDELLHEPLGTILRRVPLSERVYNAAVLRTGPYAPSLELACALESEDAGSIVQLCEAHELEPEYVNRALLRVLSELTVERPAARGDR